MSMLGACKQWTRLATTRAAGRHRCMRLDCQALLQKPEIGQQVQEVPSPAAWINRALAQFTTVAEPPVSEPSIEPDVLAALQSRLGKGVGSSSVPLVPPPKPVVIIISGPSGVGKDAVVARLKEVREDLYFVVTATSRGMRATEVEGKDYFFVSKEKFEHWIATDMLLEHALVYGDYKGIPRQQVDDALRAGTDVVLRIDVQGAATVKRLMPDAITIFIAAESEASLVTRLVGRKTENVDTLATRVATAKAEVARIPEFDFVVVNGTGQLDHCVSQVAGIIDAEKARVKRRLQT